MNRLLACLYATIIPMLFAGETSGNRLTYLDESDPYYVSRAFPKLITPQWVGEEGVEGVVILSIDDLRDPAKYEAYLRPILERLKAIDGRAPYSIFCNRTDTSHPLFQHWLKEGLSLENHTLTHPFPMLNSNSLAKSKRDYDGGIDQWEGVAHPIAFRTPNCDGRNTLSPRLLSELFNKTTEKGKFLTVDSSVFCFPTANDPELSKEIVKDADGKDRFLKYIPTETFCNSIFDYPYPYVIGNLCWEFPCMAPSDYEAQVKNGVFSDKTVDDMSAGIDAAVAKKGVFTLCHHPHGWIKNMQIVELIDRAVRKHGKKIKFLTFKEAQERIDKNLLAGHPLRASDGGDNGVRLVDLDNDGYLDVVIGNRKLQRTRLWQPEKSAWRDFDFPVPIVSTETPVAERGQFVRFGIVRADKKASVYFDLPGGMGGAQDYDGEKWVESERLSKMYPKAATWVRHDEGVRLRDIDGDGICEVIVDCEARASEQVTQADGSVRMRQFEQPALFAWSEKEREWRKLPFALPPNTSLVDRDGHDNGLRFVDLNGDGFDDIIFSNESRYSVHLFEPGKGWTREITKAPRTGTAAYWDSSAGVQIPMIARAGTNNGVWFHSKHMNIQNENVTFDRIAFADLAEGVQHVKTPHPPPQPAADARQTLKVHPGFTADLVASEPMLEDPIAFDWGPDGKLWVVEMGDYPLGTDGKGKPGGRVKILESTNGDGRYDKMTVFLDDLQCPTGVTVWKKGVLVIAAPDLFYAEDTDGDGKADVREVLYTGFKEGNQQHRSNGLARGLDNWLYGGNGDSGGKVKSLKTGVVVDISSRDFRIRPDEGLIETVAGRTQFGRTRDDWGNWFGSMNSAPLYHYPLDEHYLKRNPFAAVSSTAVKFGDHGLFPISTGVPGFTFTRRFTSACSPTVYRDDLFGPAYENSIFVSEPSHNVVHREVLSLQASAFSSERAADEPDFEFVASSDVWFRPTTIKFGPDGALWIADMYRYVIEHPQWILKEIQARVDLRAGQDRGRLYRIYPTGKRPRQFQRLDTLDGFGLAGAIDSPSGWQRDMVQQLLVERQLKDTAPKLESQGLYCPRPQTRVQALWTLQGLGELTPETLLKALGDKHAGVRLNALRLSEPFLKTNAKLSEAVLAIPEDSDDTFNLQLACTLGELSDPRAGERLSTLALKHASDPYFVSAVLSSLNKTNYAQTLAAALRGNRAGTSALLGKLVSLAPKLADEKTFASLLAQTTVPENGTHPQWQLDALATIIDSLDASNNSLAKLCAKESDETKEARKNLTSIFAYARGSMAPGTNPADRLRAVKLLGRGLDGRAEDIELLKALLTPQYDAETQAAAANTLVSFNEPRAGEILLSGWRSYSPALRSLVVQAMFRRETWLSAELTMLEEKKILPHEIDAAQRARMMWNSNPAIKERAEKIFAGVVNPDRQKVVDAFKPALALQGAAPNGAKLFTEKCANCHRLGNTGTALGPNLDALADTSLEALSIAILDPNRAIEPRYVNYQVATVDGQRFAGLLEAETPASITILEPGGKRQVIERPQIKVLASSGISVMPEGLEAGVTHQQFADLIAYVRSFKQALPRRNFAGNVPETVKPAPDGTLLLAANTSEIYGKAVAYETEHSNLGYWSNTDDYAEWNVEAARAGKYEVWLDWACVDSAAGNTFVVRSGANSMTGNVPGTGTWENYKQAKVGELALDAGPQKISFRAAQPIKGFLIDLRSIKLVPLAK